MIESELGERDAFPVPLLPAPSFVPGDEEHGSSARVEGEQDAYLAALGGSGTELLQVVIAGTDEPVNKWPPEGRSDCRQVIDGGDDQVVGNSLDRKSVV